MGADILTEIVAAKRRRVAAAKLAKPLQQLREAALAARSNAYPHALATALSNDQGINVIAEFKRRSPSKGMIRANADAPAIAREYQSGGAVAISVLTEQDYFGGSLDDFAAVRSASTLPLLRKDFIFDEYQIYESAAAGAAALLLIVAALDDDQLRRLLDVATHELELDAVVEVHTADEFKRALAVGAKIIGVNNRNLRTFEVSLTTSVELARESPDGVLLISESGLNSAQDLQQLRACGYHGFLIGESLMRAEQPGLALRGLIESPSGNL